MSVLQLQRIESNGTATSLNDHFNLQLIPKQQTQQADQGVNNDLTGNTLASEARFGYVQRIASANPNGVNFFEDILNLQQSQGEQVQGSRRLSISEYDVDNAGYYEYEYFGKQNDEMITTNFNDNEEDVVMMSDDEVRPFEFDLVGVATSESTQLPQEMESFMAEQFTDPLIDGTDEPQRKRVKDYFKLNIFGGGAADEKKKYFWNRKKKAGLKNDEDEELAVEETAPSIVINPSKLISNHQDFLSRVPAGNDNDEDEDVHAEPISQFTVFDSHVLEPPIESLAPSVVKRRSSSMPKPRGRKPSPIPDASKQFGCEHCDRRFKRQEHLKRHVRSLHMGEKPFNCLICGKKFSRSDNLNQHIKTHSHQ